MDKNKLFPNGVYMDSRASTSLIYRVSNDDATPIEMQAITTGEPIFIISNLKTGFELGLGYEKGSIYNSHGWKTYGG